MAESGAPGAREPKQYIRVFNVSDDGLNLSGGEIFHKITPGWADGFRVDENGNLWCGAADGVHCLAPDGTLIGKVLVPKQVSNLCFGDRHNCRLFMCASDSVYALFTNTRACPPLTSNTMSSQPLEQFLKCVKTNPELRQRCSQCHSLDEVAALEAVMALSSAASTLLNIKLRQRCSYQIGLAPIAAGVELEGHLWLMRIVWG